MYSFASQFKRNLQLEHTNNIKNIEQQNAVSWKFSVK